MILWTRVCLASPEPAPVRWRVATTPDLEDVVSHGEAQAVPDHDFTVNVDVRGLEPATTYYYGFETHGRSSPVGRTRTAPKGATESIRLGVVSCASWPHGFFNAYRRLAEREVDVVVHLGDYIYEDGESWEDGGRLHRPPSRLRSLADYRTRHAQYRTDADLQLLHRRHPMVAVWDDHDVAGNAWRDGAADHDPAEDGDWATRRAAAVQAYLEWVPVRLPEPNRPDRIYRTVRLGELADLIMLDTRLVGRDRPAAEGERPVGTLDDGDRSLLGPEQRAWLAGQLRESTARWRLVGNQVMMAPLRVLDVPRPLRWVIPGLVAGGAGVNAGQWDGYPAERDALFELLTVENVANVVVLTGDLHSSWAAELWPGPDDRAGPVGVEFVTPSVTARSFAGTLLPPIPGGRAALRHLIALQNRHVRYFDLDGHGYVVVDVDRNRVEAEWWHVDTVTRRSSGERRVAGWRVRDGDARLVRTPFPTREPGRRP